MTEYLRNDSEFLASTPAFHARVPEYLRATFLDTHQELMSQSKYDCNLSGSTVCSVFFDSKKIFCANVGDSRAVLFS
jgi:serine/threonine protein phosphatase PrpC